MSNYYATIILEALTQLTTAFAPLKSVEYYEAICRYTVEHFDFDYAFVGELDSISKSIHAVCGWSKEGAIKPFHYDVKNSPCHNTLSHSHAFYPHNVQQTFPKDTLLLEMGIEAYAGIALFNKSQEPIGVFVILNKTPFDNSSLVEHILKLYNNSLSAEMERCTSEQNTINLENIAYYDPLTKLPNRLLITDRIRQAIKNQSRKGKSVAICLMDLDGS